MTEHTIRLRGGWLCRAVGSPEQEERRLDLPIRWGPDETGRLILTRRFGRPPVDADRQAVWLQMENVGGIRSLVLNGQVIGALLSESSRHEIELPVLSRRNVLVLEIEIPAQSTALAKSGDDWGSIALVVRSRTS